ncbi:type II toxin-antitoxin system RelE/ParE family toxin [Blastopirellula marina]|uniref:Type II toxin-antitoxin system RelE/ParE family toxin n=1 Tax=Blastopirellula marina TaxID=124 RepID=A0A2S8F6A0_9BACT|nr:MULTISPECIES: type II toxin-antitoxin system RelE/ParE family toxin [Pirellulaceae]PQO27464.1 type II toxin-antitoxin system RelE/ParE family toxin [Blastopirellula marina]RCS48001.1 type II toxin-antitoxin system RelE/ParE family toxin [Bremerella cremea]
MPGSRAELIKSPQSMIDLFEIAKYLVDQDPELGYRFLARAEETMELLASSPLIGEPFAIPGQPNLRAKLVREFKRYVIYYRSSTQRVVIIRVLHGSRDSINELKVE